MNENANEYDGAVCNLLPHHVSHGTWIEREKYDALQEKLQDAETLAMLVLTLFQYVDIYDGPTKQEVEKLAKSLAPATITLPGHLLPAGTYVINGGAANTGDAGDATFELIHCYCGYAFPGADANNPAICPDCGKAHRL